MLFTKRVFVGGVVVCAAVALAMSAQPSHALTFSFPGSSINNSFSFVSPSLPQAMRYSFGGVVPQSFSRIIPPVVSSQYVFGGTSGQSAGSSYTYGGGSSSGSSYTYGSGSTGGYTYGTGSTSGSSGGYTYGTGSTSGSSSGSSYTYGSGSTSGSGSSGSSSSSSSGSSSSSEDNADGPADAAMVSRDAAGATVVNLILNGQQVQSNALPSFLNSQSPFSYYLIKGKPNGTGAKTSYDFKTSSNAFTLQSCNPYKKPFNWSIQVNSSSIPQSLVLMSTPQASGGQTCSAGAKGSCKKPTQACYIADAYTAPPMFSNISSVAGDHVSGWTVNMCSTWDHFVTASLLDSNGGYVGQLTSIPVGGSWSLSGPVSKSLPLTNTTIVSSTVGAPSHQVHVYTPPGPFTSKYNGINGTLSSGGQTYYFVAMGVTGAGQNQQTCVGQACVTTGITMNLGCIPSQDSSTPYPNHGMWLFFSASPQVASSMTASRIESLMRTAQVSR